MRTFQEYLSETNPELSESWFGQVAQGVGNFAKGIWGGKGISGAWQGAKQGYQDPALGYAQQLLKHAPELKNTLTPFIQQKTKALQNAYAKGQQQPAQPATQPQAGDAQQPVVPAPGQKNLPGFEHKRNVGSLIT